MKTKSKKLIYALVIYTVLFYAAWTLWELFGAGTVAARVGNDYIKNLLCDGVVKNLVWTVPAMILIARFKDEMFVDLKSMFTNRVNVLKYLPVFLLFTVYLVGGALINKGTLALSDSFKVSDLIWILFVGLTEEMVFRGWLLNATVTDEKQWAPVIVNSVMFVIIHFPKWIADGQFTANFTSLGFLGVFVLGAVFGKTFIKSRNILIPIALHMYWDLLVTLLY
ncbi:MAG: CPBP family intramembrane metalloprotease [Clostridia bacterium]|nr:CPBP family intramembrane metalloprotease [Clostridia bacterium]